MSLRSKPSRCRCTLSASNPSGAQPSWKRRAASPSKFAAPKMLARPTRPRAPRRAGGVEGDRGADDLAEALLALAVLADRDVVVPKRDAGARREPFDGFDEVEMLDLSDERDRVAALLATEAVIDRKFGIDRERRGLLGMEGAQAHEPAADALEADVLPGQRHQVGRLPDPGDVVVEDAHRASGYDGVGARPRRAVTRRGEVPRDASRAARPRGRARTGRSSH